ncbi:MAG TPA: hypothetical protein VGM21_11470 [Actinomycetota bacterium]|jgi:hypothetical protein
MNSSQRVPTAVRITVLLRLLSEGYEDAFHSRPEWLELPAEDLAELHDTVGPEHAAQLAEAAGLRRGSDYTAGGAAGTVTLTAAAHSGVLGLLGLASLPPDVLVQQTPQGPRYAVPEDWFETVPG